MVTRWSHGGYTQTWPADVASEMVAVGTPMVRSHVAKVPPGESTLKKRQTNASSANRASGASRRSCIASGAERSAASGLASGCSCWSLGDLRVAQGRAAPACAPPGEVPRRARSSRGTRREMAAAETKSEGGGSSHGSDASGGKPVLLADGLTPGTGAWGVSQGVHWDDFTEATRDLLRGNQVMHKSVLSHRAVM